MNLIESHRPIQEALVDWRYEAARASSFAERLVAHSRGLGAVARAFVLCAISSFTSKDMSGWFLRLAVWWAVLAGLALSDKLSQVYRAEAPLTLRLLWIGIWVSNALPYAAVVTSFTGRSRARSPLPVFSLIAAVGSVAWIALFYGVVQTPNLTSEISQLLAGLIFPIILLLIAEETRTSPSRLQAVVLTLALFWLYFYGLRFANARSTQRLFGAATTSSYLLLSVSLIYGLVAVLNSRLYRRVAPSASQTS